MDHIAVAETCELDLELSALVKGAFDVYSEIQPELIAFYNFFGKDAKYSLVLSP